MRRSATRPSTVGRACIVLSTGLVLTVTACASNRATRDAATTSSQPVTTTTTTTPPTTTTAPAFSYQPLFPFQTPREVADWQQAFASGGHQPWHLDAGETALAFVRFLGYTDVDRVLSTVNDTKGAHVSVGFVTEGSNTGTAAVVHVVRYGAGQNVPWEVVGTDDTDFTLDTPAYGSVITSPVRVGGRITGVDESIRVHVQQLHSNGFLGESCCTPGGGEGSPWSTTVSFAAPTDPVLIISASTGGHLKSVERFAVTGVKRG
jgi:hypothetical protein